jgi:proline iminopeptidase
MDARLADAPHRSALTHAWQVMHPPLQSFEHGWLDVGDGHAIYWEQCGHPGAPAALFVHGGPGAGSTPQDRRWFNPQQWRVVLFDQRGCGRSRAADALHANTTSHLVADIEALRLHLGLHNWLLLGGSWGATLALAYAQAHPQHVRGLVLRGVFLATAAERCWLYGDEGAAGAAGQHPLAWQQLCTAAGVVPGQPLLDTMHQRLLADNATAHAAAHAWWQWEMDLMGAEAADAAALHPQPSAAQALCAARIAVHYARANWFLAEHRLLAQAATLAALPGVIVQGSRDQVTPPAAARALHAAWPASRLHEAADAGHASTHPAMAQHLINATNAMAQTTRPHLFEETSHVKR